MTQDEHGVWSAFERGEIDLDMAKEKLRYINLQRLKELRDIAVMNYERERQRLLGNTPGRPNPPGA